MRCKTCGGTMLFDRLDDDWRCILCARPRRQRRMPTPQRQRPTFRRKWDVDPAELLTDCGA